MVQRRWRPQLTREEQQRGYVFFALFFLVFPVLKMGVEWVFDHFFELYLSEAVSAAVYYYIMAVLTVVVFWSFLRNAGTILMRFLPENLLALITGFVGGQLLSLLFGLFPWPVKDPNPIIWAEQYAYSPAATVLIVVILVPIVEEVLFRGLLFGSLRKRSRTVAWIASVGLFMVYSVWTFAVAYGDARYLILALRYLPMSLALTWCYDRGGSVWSAILLHAIFHAIVLFGAV